MRRIFLILLIVFILAAAALVFFVLRFDANQWKDIFIRQAEAATGYSVGLEDVALTWHNGLVLKLTGCSVSGDKETLKMPPVRIREIMADLELWPLLSQNIRFGALTLTRPEFKLVRNRQGNIVLAGIPLKKVENKAQAKAAFAFSFFIHALKIEQAELRFTDRIGPVQKELVVGDVNAIFKNISLTRPVSFSASMAVFGEQANIKMNGRFQVPLANQPFRLSDFSLETDLGRIDFSRVAEFFPQILETGIETNPKGDLLIKIAGLALSNFRPEAVSIDSAVELRNGELKLRNLGKTFERIHASVRLKDGQLDILPSVVSMAGGEVKLSGVIRQCWTHPDAQLSLGVSNVTVEEVLSPAADENPRGRVRGRLSGAVQAKAQGRSWPEISRTLTGEGDLSLEGGRIENLNLVREVFSRLSLIPGLVEKLSGRLPPSYETKFNARDTILADIRQTFSIHDAGLFFDSLGLATDTFQLTGIAQIFFSGIVSAQTMLRIDPDMSGALIKSVRELQYLADAKGELEIPLKVQGTVARPAVFPDLQYVASKLAVSKASEVLGDLLQKTFTKKGSTTNPSQPSQEAGQGQDNPSSQSPKNLLLGTLLNTFLQAEQQDGNAASPQDKTGKN